MASKKRQPHRAHTYTPAEERAARSERVEVREADPFGWIALSESGTDQTYHLFLDPEAKKLVCQCADFVYRGDAEPGYECKHITAVLKYVGRRYLEREYDPRKQNGRQRFS
jgi:hypothetical protein